MGDVVLCVRCDRAAPGAGDPLLFWEVWDQLGDAVVCPDCVTSDELLAMVRDEIVEIREAEVTGYLIDEEMNALGADRSAGAPLVQALTTCRGGVMTLHASLPTQIR